MVVTKLAVWTLLSLPIACSLPIAGGGEVMPLSGQIIYGVSNRVEAFTIDDAQRTILRQLPHLINGLSKIDEEHFLLAVSTVAGYSILNTDPRTGETKFVHKGWSPTYVPKHQKVFFFDTNPKSTSRSYAKTGPRLYMADMEHPTQSVKQIGADQGRFSSSPIIQVSPDEVVFLIRDDGKSPPYIYNLVTDTLKPLPFTRPCRPYVWRSKTRQLLCSEPYGSPPNFFFVDLEGTRIEDLSMDPIFLPVLYIAKHDVLIGSAGRVQRIPPIGETYDIWAYSFKEKKSWRLLKDATLSHGSAIWFE